MSEPTLPEPRVRPFRAAWPWSDRQWAKLFSMYLVPEHVREGLRAYLEHGRRTGGFLSSVLAGDLYGAISRTDDESGRTLLAVARFVLYETPSPSHGSEAAFVAWLARDLGRAPMPNDLGNVLEEDR